MMMTEYLPGNTCGAHAAGTSCGAEVVTEVQRQRWSGRNCSQWNTSGSVRSQPQVAHLCAGSLKSRDMLQSQNTQGLPHRWSGPW